MLERFARRQHRLVRLLQESGLDGLALVPGASLFYLTGLRFHLMERPILGLFTARGEQALILPELEYHRAEAGFSGYLFPYGEDPQGWPAVFQKALRALGLQRGVVGIEPTRMRVQEWHLLEQAAPGLRWKNASPLLARLKARKDADEVRAMQKAIQVAEAALLAALPALRPGIAEKEVAAELTLQLLRHGSEPELPFPPIVASGPNSADPHAMPTDRVLQPGDLVLIDWGARVEGYVSDLTRMFVLGKPQPQWERLSRLVMAAQEATWQAARPGVPMGEVDRAARRVFEEAGYATYFVHRTGHGIGLDVHEPPYLYAENQEPLEPGMTFTVEPGLYFPGQGGLRIEDDVLLTEEGPRVLSTLPRHLQVVERL